MHIKLKAIIKYLIVVLLSFLLGTLSCYEFYRKSLDGRALAMYAVAVKHLDNNEPRKAQNLLWQAIGLKNDEPWFYELLAESAERLKSYDEAKEFYRITIELYAKKNNKGKMQYSQERLRRLEGIRNDRT